MESCTYVTMETIAFSYFSAQVKMLNIKDVYEQTIVLFLHFSYTNTFYPFILRIHSFAARTTKSYSYHVVVVC